MPGEFELIGRYFTRPARTALLGVGDDCALVKQPDGLALAISTDMLVEGVHFDPAVDPESLGHKAMAVNLSDLAAMGAEPRWATLAIALPAVREDWLAAFSRGLFTLAERFGVDLIGGDTTRGPLTLSITVIGTSPPGLALRRDGAQPGDDIWLSGCTGEAGLGLAVRAGALKLPPDVARACLRRLDWPEPRVALGRALRGVAHSAIDVSDGLLQDLGHICERSSLAARIEADRLPRAQAVALSGERGMQALLAGGDDYELCFTAASKDRELVLAAAARLGVAVSRIGTLSEGTVGVTLFGPGGQEPLPVLRGYDHFSR